MRWTGVFVEETAAYLPQRVGADVAIAEGKIDSRAKESIDIESIAVSDDLTAPEMAAAAAEKLVEDARITASEIGLVIHACAYDQQHMTPASYVQHRLGITGVPGFEVRQASAAVTAGLVLAATHLDLYRHNYRILMTTAERFIPPFDRWRSMSGLVLGDGGAAILLSSHHGFARLLSTAQRSATEFAEATDYTTLIGKDAVYDARAMKKLFASTAGLGDLVQTLTDNTRQVVAEALADAGLEAHQIARVVVPHVGKRTLEKVFFTEHGLDSHRSTWSFARGIGHVGASDPILGLDHLRRTQALKPGDHVLMFTLAGGMNFAAAVLEMIS